MYATAIDMLNRFGATELAQLGAPDDSRVTAELLELTVEDSDRSAYPADEQAAADEAVSRIEGELQNASRMMDTYIAPRYRLPLASELVSGGNLVQVCTDIARFELHRTPPKDVETRYERRLTWLRDVGNGRASLGEADTGTATPGGRVVVAGGESAHDWDTF